MCMSYEELKEIAWEAVEEGDLDKFYQFAYVLQDEDGFFSSQVQEQILQGFALAAAKKNLLQQAEDAKTATEPAYAS